MLDVRRLQVLCEVARRGSLSGAAEALTYTPSAISQQIAALEREAGVTLVERRARGVVLTEAGRVLVEHAELVLAELEAAEAALAELSALRRGHLRFASFATAGATIVPPGGRCVQRAAPTGRRTCRAGHLGRRHRPTATGSVGHRAHGRPELRTGRRDHRTVRRPVSRRPAPYPPARRGAHAAPGGPGREKWIDVPRNAPDGEVLARAYEQLGIKVHVAYESDDYTAIHELVGAGLGVALLPDLAFFPANADVVLRPLTGTSPTRRIQAATRREPAAAAMLAILRDLQPRRRGTQDSAQTAATAAPPSR